MEWRRKRGARRGLFHLLGEPGDAGGLAEAGEATCRRAARLGARAFIVMRIRAEQLEPGFLAGLLAPCRRSSIAIFYDPGSPRRLPGSGVAEGVSIKVYEGGGVGEGASHAEVVQRSSWGFFQPPLPGDVVVVAFLGGSPVASAYYNPVSRNIDYGVHVVRGMWRRGLGSLLLGRVLELAGPGGPVSVVRVLRGRPLSGSDKRALLFYRSHSPLGALAVCEAVCGEG